jgi:hypothetical protein
MLFQVGIFTLVSSGLLWKRMPVLTVTFNNKMAGWNGKVYGIPSEWVLRHDLYAFVDEGLEHKALKTTATDSRTSCKFSTATSRADAKSLRQTVANHFDCAAYLAGQRIRAAFVVVALVACQRALVVVGTLFGAEHACLLVSFSSRRSTLRNGECLATLFAYALNLFLVHWIVSAGVLAYARGVGARLRAKALARFVGLEYFSAVLAVQCYLSALVLEYARLRAECERFYQTLPAHECFAAGDTGALNTSSSTRPRAVHSRSLAWKVSELFAACSAGSVLSHVGILSTKDYRQLRGVGVDAYVSAGNYSAQALSNYSIGVA